MQPIHGRRTSSLIPCLDSLPGCLGWIINQALESGKAKMFVECLLQTAWSLGLLQEEWLPSPTGTKAPPSPSAHRRVLTRPCNSSTFIYWSSGVAPPLWVRKGNGRCVLKKGVKRYVNFSYSSSFVVSFLVKGMIILFLAAVNELKPFSRVMLTCQLSVFGEWLLRSHGKGPHSLLKITEKIPFCERWGCFVRCLLWMFPPWIFLLALKPLPWCAGL